MVFSFTHDSGKDSIQYRLEAEQFRSEEAVKIKI